MFFISTSSYPLPVLAPEAELLLLFQGDGSPEGIFSISLASTLTYWLMTSKIYIGKGSLSLSSWPMCTTTEAIQVAFTQHVVSLSSCAHSGKVNDTSHLPCYPAKKCSVFPWVPPTLSRLPRGSQVMSILSPMYLSNLSSPLYPTGKGSQVHQCSSPCLLQAFKTSIPPGSPPLMPCLHPVSPSQSSAAPVVDSSDILLGLPVSSSGASAWGLSLATAGCSALVPGIQDSKNNS